MSERPPPGLLQTLAGPWEPEPSGLPPGGPQRWWRGPEGVGLDGPPARIAAEKAGWERLGPHPARPRLLASSEDCLVIEPTGETPGGLSALSPAFHEGPILRETATLREHLRRLPGRVDPVRALTGLDLKRGRLDRMLDQTRTLASRQVRSFGGITRGWLREPRDREGLLGLGWSLADPGGWSAVDLSALALGSAPPELERLRALHRAGLDREEADLAFDLGLLRRALDEAVLGRDEESAAQARELVLGLLPGAPPDRVCVEIAGAPDWLDTRRWVPADGQLPAAEARWLLRELDGLRVGGRTLQVICEPPLRAGRRPPPRSSQRERRRALFSRWEAGIQADEEGLFSATPEALAEALVAGLSGHVLDGTCGIGSLSLALARLPQVRRVTAVDTSRERLEMARHNARLYGLDARIDFVHDDVNIVLGRSRYDALVLDPPWGGRDYEAGEAPGLDSPGLDLRRALSLAPLRVRLKLPRGFDPAELNGLPGPWRPRALVDERGVIKMLVISRGG